MDDPDDREDELLDRGHDPYEGDEDSRDADDEDVLEALTSDPEAADDEDIDELFDDEDSIDSDDDEDAEWEQMQAAKRAHEPRDEELIDEYMQYLEAHEERVERENRTRYRILAVGALVAASVLGWGVWDEHIDEDPAPKKPTCAQQIEDAKERYTKALRAAQETGKPAPEYTSPSCAR